MIDKFTTFAVFEREADNKQSVKLWKIYEQPFKNMIGIMGKFFIGDRMFNTVRSLEGRSNVNYVSCRAYLYYTDIVYNGNDTQKDKISFLMIDIEGKGKVTFGEYQNFWKQFLAMYGQIL
jgi:hypothetical protein